MKKQGLTLAILIVLLVAQLNVFQFGFVKNVFGSDYVFGFDTQGLASSTSIENAIVGSMFTCPYTGNATNIGAYLIPASLYAKPVKTAIFLHSNLTLVGNSSAATVSGEEGWFDFAFSVQATLYAGLDYVLVVWGTSGTGTCKVAYDSGDTNQSHTDSETYGTWPDPLVPTHGNNKYSIYCNYTVSGDTVKPNPSNVGRDTSYIVGSSCSFYTKWTDDVGLATTGGWKFESNVSGTPTNSSWTAFTANPDWSNTSAILANGVNAWCFYANDTSNNWNGTGMQYLSISWNYRLSHVINNSTGAGTNYQIHFNVYRGIGTSTEDCVYLQNNNASTFPNDIMFTDNDAVTALHFWVQSYNSSWAGVWVEIADDLSSANVTIYVYFGKADVTSASNFENTFIAGEPFDNAVLNTTRWTSVDGNPTYTINATGHYLEVTDMDVNWDNGKGFHGKTFTFPASYMIQDAYSDLGFGMVHDGSIADYFGAIFAVEHHVWTSYDSGIAFYSITDVSNTTSDVTTFFGVGDNYDYTGIGTGTLIKIWKVGGNIVITSGGVTRVNETNSQTPDRIELGILRRQYGSFGTERFYAFIVRKYVSPEPSHGEWEADSLISALTLLVDEKINWMHSIDTIYMGMMFGKTNITDLQNAIAASTSWQDVLTWSAITLKYGIENETKIKWALNEATMVAGLPRVTTTTLGYNAFLVYYRGILYGYHWADKFSYLQDKWNTTTAFNNFALAYNWTGHGFLWYCNASYTESIDYGPRYFDECAETLACFLVFYEVCNVSEALTYAETEWKYLNNNLWKTDPDHGSYFEYANEWTGWECSGGAFLQIIGWLKYCSPDIGNISRLITDMSNRYIIDKWESPQWCYWNPITEVDDIYPAFVIHHHTSNSERRATSTMTAWSSLYAMYLLFNDTEIENFQNMLNGYGDYPGAWKALYNETADVYHPPTGQFQPFSMTNPTDFATALFASLHFFLGITPVNASLAVPVESLSYEYLYNMFDSQIFNISISTRKVTVGIGQAGALNFTFNRPVTQMFNSVGLYELTFDSNWDEITNCIKIGGLPERRYLEIVTKLVVGWNVNNAWNLDVDKTLEQICASIQYIGIGSTIIIKDNSTEYRYDYGLEPNATILILVTSDELRIYCITGGYWYHDYSNFLFRKDSVSQSVSVSLGSSKSASFGKASSQSFSIGFATWGIGEFFRSVSQTITATLNVQRLIEVFRVASQVVALALQAVGAKITVYLVDAILTITTSFQASRLAEWFKTVTQAIAMIFESIRLGEWFRSVNQSITASLTTNRLIDMARTTSLLLGISVVTLKLAQFVRATSQTFSFGFATTGIGDFFRSVTQSITAVLNVQRLGEMFRSASQTITLGLQAVGERIALYLRDAALTITTTVQASRLADWIKTVSQSLSITLQSTRLSELWKSASQTISTALTGNRLIDVTRLANQSAGFSFGSSRLADFVRTTSQAVNVDFAVASLADFFRTVSQALTVTLNAQRLIEVSKQVSQIVTFSLQTIGEKVGIYLRNAALTVTLSLQGSRLAEWFKAATQSISFTFETGKVTQFVRSVSQAISAVLNGEKMADLLRSASQTITLTLQTIGEKVGIYLRDVALTITTAFQGSRLAEWIKATSQTISVSIGTTRLAEFARATSQTVVLAFGSVGEKLGNYFANVTLTITTTFQNSRLADWTRQASQTLTLSLSTSRIAEFLALVTLTIMATVNADRLMLFARQASQTLSFLFNGERLIEVSRSVSQTIALGLEGFGEFVGDYFRTASLNLSFIVSSIGELPPVMVELALAIALIVVACVVTYAVAKTMSND